MYSEDAKDPAAARLDSGQLLSLKASNIIPNMARNGHSKSEVDDCRHHMWDAYDRQPGLRLPAEEKGEGKIDVER